MNQDDHDHDLDKSIVDYANGIRLHNEANKLLAEKLLETGNLALELKKAVLQMSEDLHECIKMIDLAHKRLSEQEARIWKLEKRG